MSFSGKRFRRTGGSNLDDFFRASCATEHVRTLMTSNAPIWCFTLLDDNTISLQVQVDDCRMRQIYRLGEEQELVRRDGAKVKMTVTLEGDNVLKQKIVRANGQTAYFRREFQDRTATMTITREEAQDRKAHVFYEVVD